MEHWPYSITPGNNDYGTVGEHSDVLHFFAAEHSRTNAEYLPRGHVDELGKVIG